MILGRIGFVWDEQCGPFGLLFKYVIVYVSVYMYLFIFLVTGDNHSIDTDQEKTSGNWYVTLNFKQF